MNRVYAQLSLALASSLCLLQGCTDRDREMAARKDDGTDSFVFKPPPELGNTNKDSVSNKPKAKPARLLTNDSDGTDTFVFKPPPSKP